MSLNDLLPNWTLVPQMLIFWSVLWILSRYIFKPYGALIELRIKETTGLLREAERISIEANELRNRYEEKMNSVRTELHKMLDDEKRKYQSESDSIVLSAKENANLEIQKIKKIIHDESEKVTKELSSQVEKFSEEIANKIIGRGITL